jgi:nucleotide-binding universal stress UspA family protein
MRLLIASDDSPAATNAAHFAALFARPASADITLLGVVPEGRSANGLLPKLQALQQTLLEGGGLTVKIKIRHGDPVEEIARETEEHFYQMVVIGSRTRHGLGRLLFGSSARGMSRLLSQLLRVPLLVVSEGFQTIKRVLIRTSGEKAGEIDARMGGAVAALVNADVKIVHVMSQIALIPDAPLPI